MSELKEVYAYQSDEIESLVGNANGNSYYLKSEADKVIEKKDKEIAKLKEQVALLQAEFIPEPGV